MQTYIWVSLILFLAGFTHGLSGFGSVLISLPLLALLLEIKTVIPIAALAAATMALMVLVQVRRQFEWKNTAPLILGAVPGIVVGVLLLKLLDSEVIHWILGTVLILYALMSLLLGSPSRDPSAGWAYPFGFLAGCAGGALGAPGPPVIIYTSLRLWTKDQMKATLQGFFLISGVIIVLSHAVSGLTTGSVLRFYGVALPSLILGTYVGSRLYGIIPEPGYRKVVLFLLAGLGIFMLVGA
jgi:uncharacterized membrane protein YfcA